MTISLQFLIEKTMASRKGTFTISNMAENWDINFVPGLNLKPSNQVLPPKKFVPTATKFQTHVDYPKCIALLESTKSSGYKKKEILRHWVNEEIGRHVPHRVFDDAYSKVFPQKRGRPRNPR